jgi:hypothetical protein
MEGHWAIGSVTDYLPYRDIFFAAARGDHAMNSLPTGTTQFWFIAAAVALSPILVLFIADVIGRVRRHEWWVRQSHSVVLSAFEPPLGTACRQN